MPDPVVIATALGVAAAAAAVLVLICGWPWRAARRPRFDAGWALGVGAGFFLGCWALGIRPHWPPREDQDRLLGLVLPAVVVVELLAAFPRVPRWLVLPLRSAVAASGAGILLYGSIYLSDVAGPGTREWSPVQAWLILGGMAAALAAVWALLALLSRRARGCRTRCAWRARAPGQRLTVMLSGYATGGQVGLPLAAAVLGAAAAVLVLPRSSRGDRSDRSGDRGALQSARDRPLLRRAHHGSRHPVVLRSPAGLAARAASLAPVAAVGARIHPRYPGGGLGLGRCRAFLDDVCRGFQRVLGL